MHHPVIGLHVGQLDLGLTQTARDLQGHDLLLLFLFCLILVIISVIDDLAGDLLGRLGDGDELPAERGVELGALGEVVGEERPAGADDVPEEDGGQRGVVGDQIVEGGARQLEKSREVSCIRSSTAGR